VFSVLTRSWLPSIGCEGLPNVFLEKPFLSKKQGSRSRFSEATNYGFSKNGSNSSRGAPREESCQIHHNKENSTHVGWMRQNTSWSMEDEHQLISCLKRLIYSWRVSFQLNTVVVLLLIINNVHLVLLKKYCKCGGTNISRKDEFATSIWCKISQHFLASHLCMVIKQDSYINNCCYHFEGW